MQFKPWKPKTSNVYIRFYIGDSDEYIGKVKGIVSINSQYRKDEINSFLISQGINILEVSGITEMGTILEEKGLLTTQNTRRYQQNSNVYGFNTRENKNNYKQPDNFEFRNLSPNDLYNNSLNLNVSKAPFLESTIKNTIIQFDHREPSALHELLFQTRLNVIRCQLNEGDILIRSEVDESRILLIERKTITDFYQGLVSNDKHCHEQAERYYSLTQEYASKGIFLQVVWIMEGEKNGSRLMYNALPEIKQMDGWVNYIQIILNQHIVQSYSLNHTAYLIAKFVQGFQEQSLFYKVTVGGVRIDKTKTQRKEMEIKPIVNNNVSHGVIQSKDGIESLLTLIPSINKKVAKELVSTGMSFAEIVNLSENELNNIKGIGKKTAYSIYSTFNDRKK
jgi:ERCC4-type nuclease